MLECSKCAGLFDHCYECGRLQHLGGAIKNRVGVNLAAGTVERLPPHIEATICEDCQEHCYPRYDGCPGCGGSLALHIRGSKPRADAA